MRLLVVEDEEDLLEVLCYGLRKRGDAADSTGNGGNAVELCDINNYDLVILDLNLPGASADRKQDFTLPRAV